MPRLRRLVGTRVTSMSSKKIFPDVGTSSPAIMRIKVVFPHPEGPRSTVTDDFGTVNVMSSTAFNGPKLFVTFFKLMSYTAYTFTNLFL